MNLFAEAESLYGSIRQPGTGQVSDASEVHVSPDGQHAAFTGTIVHTLTSAPASRICLTALASGDTRVITFGPNTDRSPMFSPDGRQVAFLSDRHKAGDFQLYLLDPISGAVRSTPGIQSGWVEYLQWSPDGTRLLLGVAGHGADVAGGQGAVASQQITEPLPSWLPVVETGDESYRWRQAWIYDIESDRVRQVSRPDCNVWEAAWCGPHSLAMIASAGPSEGLWYGARLYLLDVRTGERGELYSPTDQLGLPAASPSGKYLAVVEAVCSDRGVVAGDLQLIDTASGTIRAIDTASLDVTCLEWRSDRHLLVAGHRGFQTVVGLYERESGSFKEAWCNDGDVTASGRYIKVAGIGEQGDCVLVGESFVRAPELGSIRHGEYHTVKSFDVGYRERAKAISAVERITWSAPDGLLVQGWLLRPVGRPPYPLVMNIHGGPVGQWRPRWLGRPGSLVDLMLLEQGYALFYPNPRGSSGRGREYARRVKGDMGGAETSDHLSGLDRLVELGLIDSSRIGVMGGSHGGYMTSWLITQSDRFAAAVSIAPVTDRVSQFLTCSHSHYVPLFVGDRYDNAGGLFFQRSPIVHAHKAKAPTLNIAGALDRCTPPSQAVEFHNALLASGVKSVLAIYPREGHGIRGLPAALDYTARIAAWFQEHMPPGDLKGGVDGAS